MARDPAEEFLAFIAARGADTLAAEDPAERLRYARLVVDEAERLERDLTKQLAWLREEVARDPYGLAPRQIRRVEAQLDELERLTGRLWSVVHPPYVNGQGDVAARRCSSCREEISKEQNWAGVGRCAACRGEVPEPVMTEADRWAARLAEAL
jgi:hypothetical protein